MVPDADSAPDVPGSAGPVAPRVLLEQDRARTQRRLGDLREDYAEVVEASRFTNADDEHDPEGQTIAFERSQTGALARQAERHLGEVEAALARVADGRHGTCASCGRPVAPERLEARPTARTCIDCART